MALGRIGQSGLPTDSGAAAKAIDLTGDSPEIVALALLRQLAQLEQQRSSASRPALDRKWVLDAYAECLAAVRGERGTSEPESAGERRKGRTVKPAG